MHPRLWRRHLRGRAGWSGGDRTWLVARRVCERVNYYLLWCRKKLLLGGGGGGGMTWNFHCRRPPATTTNHHHPPTHSTNNTAIITTYHSHQHIPKAMVSPYRSRVPIFTCAHSKTAHLLVSLSHRQTTNPRPSFPCVLKTSKMRT